jgi:hypothetical protein
MVLKPLHHGTAGLVATTRVATTARGTIDNINVEAKFSVDDFGQELLHVKGARKNEGFLSLHPDIAQTSEYRLEFRALGECLRRLDMFVARHQRWVLGKAHEVRQQAERMILLTTSMRSPEHFQVVETLFG